MKTIPLLALLIFVSGNVIRSEPVVAIRQSAPLASRGGDGTVAYLPLPDERPFLEKVTEKPINFWAHIKMPKMQGVSAEEHEAMERERVAEAARMIPSHDYELAKQVGEYVGWCGIVRGNEFDAASTTTRLLVEHKYFDGLTDLHQQIVSIHGAGDFHVVLPGRVTADEVPPLCLVRVYGTMFNDEAGRPTLNADYVCVWRWGLFAFMDYGTDKSRPDWVKLRRKTGAAVYDSRVSIRYYEELLGKR